MPKDCNLQVNRIRRILKKPADFAGFCFDKIYLFSTLIQGVWAVKLKSDNCVLLHFSLFRLQFICKIICNAAVTSPLKEH